MDIDGRTMRKFIVHDFTHDYHTSAAISFTASGFCSGQTGNAPYKIKQWQSWWLISFYKGVV